MKKLAVQLTNYLIDKDMAEESTRDIYEYGLQTAAETVLSFVISILIALSMNMLIDGLFFFLIFIPLRTYAGGLHLKRYWSCLLLSCITFFGTLFFIKYWYVPILISLIFSCILLGIIWLLYPVENINRPVDADEKTFFQKKINIVLLVIFLVAILLFILKQKKILLLLTVTLVLIAVTMMLGKIKYGRN